MGYGFGYSSYSVSVLNETSLADDPSFVTFMIESGKSVDIVYTASNTDELIRQVLQNPEVDPEVIARILGVGDEFNRNTKNIALLEEFTRTGSRPRVPLVLGEVVYLLGGIAEDASAAMKRRIFGLLEAVVDPNVDQDTVGQSFLVRMNIAVELTDKSLAMKTLDDATAYAVSVSSMPGPIKDALHGRSQNTGRYWWGESWFEDLIERMSDEFASKDLFIAFENSPMSDLIDMEYHAGRMVVDDGSFAIDYANRNGWTPEFIEAAHSAEGQRSKRDKSAGYAQKIADRLDNILRAAITGDDIPLNVRRAAFGYAIDNSAGNPSSVIFEHLDEFIECLCVEPSDEDNLDYDLSSSYLIRRACNTSEFKLVEAIAYIDNLDSSEVHDVVSAVTRSVQGEKARGTLTSEQVNGLWERFAVFIAQHSSGKGHVDSARVAIVNGARIALINTGLMDRKALAEFESDNSSLGAAVRNALGKPEIAVVDKPTKTRKEKVRTWDNGITGNTSFRDYITTAQKSGFTPIAGMALYCTDTRIDLSTRREARDDLMGILAQMPERAREVPDEVWGNLNRVKDTLPISGDLASVLYEIGGSARKLGSKHLIKSVLL